MAHKTRHCPLKLHNSRIVGYAEVIQKRTYGACRAAFALVGTIEQHDLAISGQQLQRDGPPSLVDFAL
jgi:hypothetical protein